MAWIEAHQALTTHRKLKTLARALHVRRSAAVGHLICLWIWALDNAPNGDITGIDGADIKEAADWPKAPEALLAAMQEKGWICSPTCHHEYAGDRLLLHDWDDYAGRLIGKRADNTKRMRDARAAQRATHVHARAAQRATHVQGLPTQQNTTLPHTTEPEAGGRRAVNAWERQSPMSINPAIVTALDGWIADGVPIEWIEMACDAAGREGGRKGVRYVQTILERYQRQGSTADKPKAASKGTIGAAPESQLIINGQAVTPDSGMLTEAERAAQKAWDEAHPDELQRHKERHGRA